MISISPPLYFRLTSFGDWIGHMRAYPTPLDGAPKNSLGPSVGPNEIVFFDLNGKELHLK